MGRGVERAAAPRGTHGAVERPSCRAVRGEVRGVQDLRAPEAVRDRPGQPEHPRRALELARDERVLEGVGLPVGRRGQQQGERGRAVGVARVRRIVVGKGHGLLGLGPGLQVGVEVGGPVGHDHPVPGRPLGQLVVEHGVDRDRRAAEPARCPGRAPGEQPVQPVGVEPADDGVGRVRAPGGQDAPAGDGGHRLPGAELDPGVHGEAPERLDELVDPAPGDPDAVARHDGGHARVQGRGPCRADTGVEGVDGDDLAQALRHPGEAVEVVAGREPAPVQRPEPAQRGIGRPVQHVGGQQPGDVRAEHAVLGLEAGPGRVPWVPGRDGQLAPGAAVVVRADRGQALQLQPGGLLGPRRSGSRGAGVPQPVQAAEELLPHPREGEEGRSGVQALPLGLEPAALAAEVVGGLEEGDAVTGVAEQHGRGQPPDPPADDDDAAHGYSPKNSATVSCTPATAPAT